MIFSLPLKTIRKREVPNNLKKRIKTLMKIYLKVFFSLTTKRSHKTGFCFLMFFQLFQDSRIFDWSNSFLFFLLNKFRYVAHIHDFQGFFNSIFYIYKNMTWYVDLIVIIFLLFSNNTVPHQKPLILLVSSYRVARENLQIRIKK